MEYQEKLDAATCCYTILRLAGWEVLHSLVVPCHFCSFTDHFTSPLVLTSWLQAMLPLKTASDEVQSPGLMRNLDQSSGTFHPRPLHEEPPLCTNDTSVIYAWLRLIKCVSVVRFGHLKFAKLEWHGVACFGIFRIQLISWNTALPVHRKGLAGDAWFGSLQIVSWVAWRIMTHHDAIKRTVWSFVPFVLRYRLRGLWIRAV